MSRHNRWAYMANSQHKSANDDCPECTEPSRSYHQGAKTVNGVTTVRYACEHNHAWTVTEDGSKPSE